MQLSLSTYAHGSALPQTFEKAGLYLIVSTSSTVNVQDEAKNTRIYTASFTYTPFNLLYIPSPKWRLAAAYPDSETSIKYIGELSLQEAELFMQLQQGESGPSSIAELIQLKEKTHSIETRFFSNFLSLMLAERQTHNHRYEVSDKYLLAITNLAIQPDIRYHFQLIQNYLVAKNALALGQYSNAYKHHLNNFNLLRSDNMLAIWQQRALVETKLQLAILFAQSDQKHLRQEQHFTALPCHSHSDSANQIEQNLALANCLISAAEKSEELISEPNVALSWLTAKWLYLNGANDHLAAQALIKNGIEQYAKHWSATEATSMHQFLAHSYYRNGALANALLHYRQALAHYWTFYNDDLTVPEHISLTEDIADNYFNIAFLYNQLGNYLKAERYFYQTIQLRENIGRQNSAAVAKSYYASAQRNLGNPGKAKALHQEALGTIPRDSYYHLTSKIELAKDEIKLKNPLAAETIVRPLLSADRLFNAQKLDIYLVLLEAAIMQHQKTKQEEAITELMSQWAGEKPDSRYLLKQLSFYNLLITKYFKEQNLPRLLSTYERAKSLSKIVQHSLRESDAFSASMHSLFQNYFSSRLMLQDIKAADVLANFFETLDQYNTQNFNLRKTDGATDKNESDSYWLEKINAEKRVLTAEGDKNKQLALFQADLVNDRWRLLQNKTLGTPIQTEHISAKELQNQLADNQVFANYFFSERINVAIFVSKESIWLQRLPNEQKLMEYTLQTSPSLIRKSLGKIAEDASLSALLPQKEQQVHHKTVLIKSAQGLLEALAFDLINTSNDEYNYSPALRSFEFINTPSASLYFGNTSKQVEHTYDVAIVANPIIDKATFVSKGGNNDYEVWRSGLQNLPYTEVEANNVKRTLVDKDVKIWVGEEANNKVLLSTELRSAKILHLATHGYFDRDEPEIVAFATSTAQSVNSDEHDFITLSELRSAPFFSDLVVISGCETTLGQNFQGVGMNSLSRNFLLQGAGSVLSTIWRIPDKPTALFMQYFYAAMKRNHGNTSASLTEAKKRMVRHNRYRDPIYWSGFVVSSVNKQFQSGLL